MEKDPTLALADSYVDRGVTGIKFDRPDFNRMIEDIRAGKIECVVVKELFTFSLCILPHDSKVVGIFITISFCCS